MIPACVWVCSIPTLHLCHHEFLSPLLAVPAYTPSSRGKHHLGQHPLSTVPHTLLRTTLWGYSTRPYVPPLHPFLAMLCRVHMCLGVAWCFFHQTPPSAKLFSVLMGVRDVPQVFPCSKQERDKTSLRYRLKVATILAYLVISVLRVILAPSISSLSCGCIFIQSVDVWLMRVR